MAYNIVAAKAVRTRAPSTVTSDENLLTMRVNYANLLNFRHRRGEFREDQFAPYCCLHCLPPRKLPLRNLERQTLALASGRWSLRSLAWILRTGFPLNTCRAAGCMSSCQAKTISISLRAGTDTIRPH